MLVGREQELQRIRDMIVAARSGAVGALVVSGEPGIGKTELLRAALAGTDDALVLRARGVELESDLPYAGLESLFRPVVGSLDALPPRQAEALSGALALGPSVSGDRLAVSAATLRLLTTLAEHRSVVVAIDDAQWIDRASLEALAFTGRRLESEGIVLLFTIRERELAASPLRGFDVLALRGLDERASRTLIANQIAPTELNSLMIKRLIADAGGNPLALMELPALARNRSLDSTTEPLPVSELIEAAFRQSYDDLPERTQSALVQLAILESAPMGLLESTLAHSGGALADIEPAVSAGLIADDHGTLSFRHPLVRAVVYHNASISRRRSAHEAAAAQLTQNSPDFLSRRAWHLIRAGTVTDEELATRLQAHADREIDQHRYAAAAHAYERAAQLSSTVDLAGLRLLRAADATRLGGAIEEASALLSKTATTTTDPRVRMEAEYHRARLEMFRGHSRTGRETLAALATAVEPINPGVAAVMLSDIAVVSVDWGDFQTAEAVSRKAFDLAGSDVSEIGFAVRVVRAFVMVLAGRKAAGQELLRSAMLLSTGNSPVSRQWSANAAILVAGLTMFALEQPSGQSLVTRAVADARESGAFGVLPYRVAHLAWIEFNHGNTNQAITLAHETLLLAGETGWENLTPVGLLTLARIEGVLGREQDCRQHAEAGQRLAGISGNRPHVAYADFALASLAMGKRDWVTALDLLQRAGRTCAEIGLGETPLLPWRSALAEAYSRQGRTRECGPLLDALAQDLREWPAPTEAAVLARCRALMEPAAFAGHIEEAMDWHEKSANPFERARTQLCFGEHLRRQGRPSEARPWLQESSQVFQQLGTAGWQQQAASELRATGLRVERDPTPNAAARLTAQELQVALAVADGKSNREVAGQLYLSVKTIEFHLGNAYRKLGASRRSQLAGLLGGARSGGVR